MVRNIQNRYNGLPPRTAGMLYQVVRKFYRGAIHHVPFIQQKKQDVLAARESGSKEQLARELYTLFCEFHFYVTCWLQIDLALYRLSRMENAETLDEIRARFAPILQRHLHVREKLDKTDQCVEEQFSWFGDEMLCVVSDGYVFGPITFTVDEESVQSLHALYQAIMEARDTGES